MEFKDIYESGLVNFVETPEDKLFLGSGDIKFGKSDWRNKNNRVYPDIVADVAIKKFDSESQKGVGIVGQLDHPIGTAGTLLANASHLITKVWKDKEKVWWAEVKIMNTSRGRDLLAVVKTGAKIGASLRGVGEIDREGRVKSGLEIRAVDFVSSPSFGASATIDQSNVFESYIADEKYEFNEDDLTAVTDAMDGLNDGVIALIQEKLAKDDDIEMTPQKIKAFVLWIKMQKDDPNIPPFNKWFKEQEEKFAQDDPNYREVLNEGLRRDANFKAEERIAGSRSSANLMFDSRKRIEARQKEIDKALEGKTMTEQTVSRLFAEYVLAGGHLSRADWIKEFGF
jgi:hypothetical protein